MLEREIFLSCCFISVIFISCFPSLHVELPEAQKLQNNIEVFAIFVYRYWREKSLTYYIIKAIMKKNKGRIQTWNIVTFCALF